MCSGEARQAAGGRRIRVDQNRGRHVVQRGVVEYTTAHSTLPRTQAMDYKWSQVAASGRSGAGKAAATRSGPLTTGLE